MIAAKIEKVCGGDFDEIREGRFAAEARLGSGHCGLEQFLVTDAAGAAERVDDGRVDLPHVVHRQVGAIGGRDVHASRFNVLR